MLKQYNCTFEALIYVGITIVMLFTLMTIHIKAPVYKNQIKGPVKGYDLHQVSKHLVKNNLTKGYAQIKDLPTPHEHTTLVQCSAILNNSQKEIKKATILQRTFRDYDPKKMTQELYDMSKNCSNFLQKRKYLTKPVNKEEEQFPIAFSLLMFKDVFQTERLLRAIYRPQNIYCIHVDMKSSPIIHQTMRNIAKCFNNVFIPSTLVTVKWGTFSVVKAELVCLKNLLEKSKTWKYFMNLCGQEFPIKTNLEVVRVLKTFNGSNDIEGTSHLINHRVMNRIKFVYKRDNVTKKIGRYMRPSFPYNVTWARGSTHAIFTRGFAEFYFYTKVGREFIKYISDTQIPDEHVWCPINLSPNLGAPGSYKGFPSLTPGTSVTRYKLWGRGNKFIKCHGKLSKNICIVSLGDLQQIVSSKKLFVNKFHANYHPLAYDCLEEYVWNSTRLDIQGINRLNMKYYAHLPFVKNHI